MSGVLSFIGKSGEPPTPPINLIADFAGGGLLCALGICMALVERNRSGKGQIIDCSMTEGAAYVGSWLSRSRDLPIWGNRRGNNLLDGGAFYYRCYETSDGKYMSVGALEPQFFEEFIRILGLKDINQFDDDSEKITHEIENIFKSKTQMEWSNVFEGVDACVLPVLDWQNGDKHPHNIHRNAFVEKDKCQGKVVPNPAPKLSRTPAVSGVLKEDIDNFTAIQRILKDINYSNEEIRQLSEDGVLILPTNAKL